MTIFDEALLQIINDKQSGSVAILQQLIRGVSAFLIREKDDTTCHTILQDRMPLMHGGLGHFEVVSHFLRELEKVLTEKHSIKKSNDRIFDFVDHYNKHWKNANAEVAEIASQNIDCQGKTILLHSNSSVITSFFNKISKQNLDISFVQTESRPENEGQYQAKKLAALGYRVKYVVDAGAAFMMDEVDMMLTGADQIHPNYFVNKIGTYALTLICREKGIPVHVLADSRKISKNNVDLQSIYNVKRPGSDIWKVSNPNIEMLNFYFEAIPTELVNSFINEKNVLTTDELRNKLPGIHGNSLS